MYTRSTRKKVHCIAHQALLQQCWSTFVCVLFLVTDNICNILKKNEEIFLLFYNNYHNTIKQNKNRFIPLITICDTKNNTITVSIIYKFS